MNIFGTLFRSRDKPINRTAGSNYNFLMGSSSAGKLVTERSAMQITAVYSCVRIFSETVATLEDENDKKITPKWKKNAKSLKDFCGITSYT